MRPIETWIALGLLVVAGIAAAATVVPRRDLIEEECAPRLPAGAPVALKAHDRVAVEAGAATRTVDLVPERWAGRALARTCEPFLGGETSARAGEPSLRVTIVARGPDAADETERVHVMGRAVLAGDTLVLAPVIELRTHEHTLRVSVSVRAPAGVAAATEAWP